MKLDVPVTISKAPNAAIAMADISESLRIHELGIALRNVLVKMLKNSHQTAEPTNTPLTIVITVDHSRSP